MYFTFQIVVYPVARRHKTFFALILFLALRNLNELLAYWHWLVESFLATTYISKTHSPKIHSLENCSKILRIIELHVRQLLLWINSFLTRWSSYHLILVLLLIVIRLSASVNNALLGSCLRVYSFSEVSHLLGRWFKPHNSILKSFWSRF